MRQGSARLLAIALAAAGVMLAACGAPIAVAPGATLTGLSPTGATLTPNAAFAASGTNYGRSVEWFDLHTDKTRTTKVGFRVWWVAAPTDSPDVVAAGVSSVAEVDAATGVVLRKVNTGSFVGKPMSLSRGLVLVPFGATSGLLVWTENRTMSVVSLTCEATAGAASNVQPQIGVARDHATEFAIACGTGPRIRVIEAEIRNRSVAILRTIQLGLPGVATAMAFSQDNAKLYLATEAEQTGLDQFVDPNDAGVTVALSSSSLRVLGAHWSGSNSIAITSDGRSLIEQNASGVALQVLDTARFTALGAAERCAVPWQQRSAEEGVSSPPVQASCASGIDYVAPHASLGSGVFGFQWVGLGRYVVVTYDSGSEHGALWIGKVSQIRHLPRSHTSVNDTACQS